MLVALTVQQSRVVLRQVVDVPLLGDVLGMPVLTWLEVEAPSVVRHILHRIRHSRLLVSTAYHLGSVLQ